MAWVPIRSVNIGHYSDLIDEAKKNIAPVQDLMVKAAAALNRAGTVPAVFKMTFYEADWLYAVDREGHLFKFRHETITDKSQREEKPKPYTRMVSDTARVNSAILAANAAERSDSTQVSATAATRLNLNASSLTRALGVNPATKVTKADSNSTTLARKRRADSNVAELVSKQPRISHELSRAKLEGGSWEAFFAAFASDWIDGDLIVYGLNANGDLIWRRISGIINGLDTPPASVTEAAQRVGQGWNSLKNVFSTGEGVVYGVAANGDLFWYRHKNDRDGNAAPQWESRVVGVGWGSFTRLFSPGEGVIYALKPDGTLLWYKHNGYLTGADLNHAGAWQGPKTVGSGWQNFKQVFTAGDGHIYAVNAAGELLYYNHKGWRTGAFEWDAPVKLGDGWGNYSYVFAAMGGKPGGPVVR